MEKISLSEWWAQKKIDYLRETEFWHWQYLRQFWGPLRKFVFWLKFPFSFTFFLLCYLPVSFLVNFPLSKAALFRSIPKETPFFKKTILWVIALPQIIVFFFICIALWSISMMLPAYLYLVLWFQLTELFY